MSVLRGYVVTMFSNNVFPRSTDPWRNSSCANLRIISTSAHDSNWMLLLRRRLLHLTPGYNTGLKNPKTKTKNAKILRIFAPLRTIRPQLAKFHNSSPDYDAVQWKTSTSCSPCCCNINTRIGYCCSQWKLLDIITSFCKIWTQYFKQVTNSSAASLKYTS